MDKSKVSASVCTDCNYDALVRKIASWTALINTNTECTYSNDPNCWLEIKKSTSSVMNHVLSAFFLFFFLVKLLFPGSILRLQAQRCDSFCQKLIVVEAIISEIYSFHFLNLFIYFFTSVRALHHHYKTLCKSQRKAVTFNRPLLVALEP